ncbi:MAG: hypothetical protein INQ03_16295 [Candidatus Heimdallarchaeota archaeon]|nr:hypothetical protein [Candidatus Heimdallarchaeota archaeon]
MYQLRLQDITLKKNFDSHDKLDEILGRSIFKNEVYWVAMVWESLDLEKINSINFEEFDKHLLNPYYIICEGKDELVVHDLWPSTNESPEKPNKILLNNQILWQGNLEGNKMLHYHIWVIENDLDVPLKEEILNIFRSEFSMDNFIEIHNYLKPKIRPSLMLDAIITAISRIGVYALTNKYDDHISTFHGSFIDYILKHDLGEYSLEHKNCNISLVLEEAENRISFDEGSFITESGNSVYFRKMMRKLHKSFDD